MSPIRGKGSFASTKNQASHSRTSQPGQGFSTTTLQQSASTSAHPYTTNQLEPSSRVKRPRSATKLPTRPTTTTNQSTKSQSLSHSFTSSSPFSSSASNTPRKALGRIPPPPVPPSLLLPTPRAILHERLAAIDWSKCHPSTLNSLVFRIEYDNWGNPTSRQAKGPSTFKFQPPPITRGTGGGGGGGGGNKPSWENDGDVKALIQRFDEEEFVAVVWCRDVLGPGVDAEETEWTFSLRTAVVRQVPMFLIGREFPFRKVLMMGLIVGKHCASGDQLTAFFVDDGTGIVECKCSHDPPLFNKEMAVAAQDNPEPLSAHAKWENLASRSKTPVPAFKLGQWVKVVGTVANGWKGSDADRVVEVDSIERIGDINVAIKHLLTVKRLHEEVYSQKFDLNSRLEEITTKQREAEKEWGGSQCTNSEAGSPRKKRRKMVLLPPDKLPPSSITLDTFKTYVTATLKNHFLTIISSSPSLPPSPTKSGLLRPIQDGQSILPEESASKAFSLGDLEKSRKLVRFAKLLAIKKEKEKREKEFAARGSKRMRMAKVEVEEEEEALGEDEQRWTAKRGDGLRERLEFALPGRLGGTVVLLPPPSGQISIRGGERRTKRDQVAGEEEILKGRELERAIKHVFVAALRVLRKEGVIVLTVPDEEEQEDFVIEEEDPKELERRQTSDRRAEFDRIKASFGGPGSPKKQKSPSPSLPSPPHPSVYLKRAPKGPLKPLYDEPAEPLATPKASTSRRAYGNAFAQSPTFPSLPQGYQSHRGKKPLPDLYDGPMDDEIPTPKAVVRIQKRASPPPPSPSPPPAATKLPSPNLHNHRTWPVSANISNSTINSTSILALQEETYQLVTPSNLSIPILQYVTREMSRPLAKPRLNKRSTTHEKTDSKKKAVETRPRGLSEADIRNHLGRDARWEAVAESSPLVRVAMDWLIDMGKVDKFGELVTLLEGRRYKGRQH